MATAIIVSLGKLSKFVNLIIPLIFINFLLFGIYFSPFWHLGTIIFLSLSILNFYYLYIQKKHTILSNFGIMGQLRYIMESVGPEFRQYFFMSDTQERPFSREDRSEVYRKAKNIDSSLAFGSQKEFDSSEIKIRHSMYPTNKDKIEKYR